MIDGVNDAPALAAADVGVATGARGADAALEAAPVALFSEELGALPGALRLIRASRRTIHLNIVAAVLTKAAVLVLAAFGKFMRWGAVLGDVGTALAVIDNSLLLLLRPRPRPGGGSSGIRSRSGGPYAGAAAAAAQLGSGCGGGEPDCCGDAGDADNGAACTAAARRGGCGGDSACCGEAGGGAACGGRDACGILAAKKGGARSGGKPGCGSKRACAHGGSAASVESPTGCSKTASSGGTRACCGSAKVGTDPSSCSRKQARCGSSKRSDMAAAAAPVEPCCSESRGSSGQTEAGRCACVKCGQAVAAADRQPPAVRRATALVQLQQRSRSQQITSPTVTSRAAAASTPSTGALLRL